MGWSRKEGRTEVPRAQFNVLLHPWRSQLLTCVSKHKDLKVTSETQNSRKVGHSWPSFNCYLWGEQTQPLRGNACKFPSSESFQGPKFKQLELSFKHHPLSLWKWGICLLMGNVHFVSPAGHSVLGLVYSPHKQPLWRIVCLAFTT